MALRRVKIIDTNFAHAKYTTDYQFSKYIEWDRSREIRINEPVFITDNMMLNANFFGNKIGMLMEPRAINPTPYNWVINNHQNFNHILTYDKELLDLGHNFIFYPHGGCWISESDQKIYPKKELVSIIASPKRHTIGHNLRHDVIDALINTDIKLGVFGRGYTPVDYKLEALANYAFTIVIENSKIDYYFTEKLIDAFVTGTVPVYWGCPSIGKFFNTDGMIIFDDVNDLLSKLGDLSFDKYNSMLPAINENFEKAKDYLIAEDWIFKNTDVF